MYRGTDVAVLLRFPPGRLDGRVRTGLRTWAPARGRGVPGGGALSKSGIQGCRRGEGKAKLVTKQRMVTDVHTALPAPQASKAGCRCRVDEPSSCSRSAAHDSSDLA